MSKTEKIMFGVDLDKAYAEYKKRLPGRLKYVEKTLGGTMFDGNKRYDKNYFKALAAELLNNKGLLEANPAETAKLVVNYQAYGDFSSQQADALKHHLGNIDINQLPLTQEERNLLSQHLDPMTDRIKLTTEQARTLSPILSRYYEDLKKQGLTAEEAKNEISWIFFGSK